jgi:hypothetical protein
MSMMERYLATLGTPGPALFAVAGFLATAFLLGWGILGRRLALRPHETFFLSLTFGIDLVVLIATPFLWLGFLPNLLLKIIFAGSLAGVVLLLVLRRRALANLWLGVPWHMAPFLLLGLVLAKNALGYPYQYDDLTYQVAVPERWMKADSLEVFRDNPFSAFPGVNLIGNLLLLKAGGVVAPMLFTYALGLLLAVAVHYLVRERTGPWTGTIFSLSFVLSESFLMVTTSAFAEPWILLQFTGLLFLVRRPGKETWEFVLMGVFAGFAASVKLTGIIIPVAAGLLVIFKSRPLLARLVQFLGPMLLVMLIFYARPFLDTGDPVYPYFAWMFSDQEAMLAMSTYHHDAGKQRFGSTMSDPWQIALFYCETPLLLCLSPVLHAERTYDGSFGLQGLWHLALATGLLLRAYRQRNRGADFNGFIYLGGAVLFYTFWFFTAQQSRFLLPGCLCVLLSGSCLGDFFSKSLGKWLLVALVVLTWWSLPNQIVDHIRNSWNARQPIDLIYSGTNDEYLKACKAIEQNTPAGAKILLLYENRGLYIPREYRIGTPYFQERFFTPPDHIDEKEFLAELRHEGFTHVLVGWSVKDPDRMKKYLELAEPFKQCLIRLDSHGFKHRTVVSERDAAGRDVAAYVLYELK